MSFNSQGGSRQGFGLPAGFRLGGPVTPVIKYFMIACVAAYFVQLMWRRFGIEPPAEAIFGLYTPYLFRGAFFQLFTSHFLHGGLMHLGFNMLVLWMFAGELELLWGPRKFIVFMAVSGVGANLCQVLAFPHLAVPVIGASGIVYGILMAFGLTYPNRVVLLFFVIPVPVKYLVIGIGAIELLSALEPGNASNVAHLAHLGGMLFGFLYLRWDRVFLRLRDQYYRRKLERQRGKHKDESQKKREERGIYVIRGDDDEPPFIH
jgi:rhomboid family protein